MLTFVHFMYTWIRLCNVVCNTWPSFGGVQICWETRYYVFDSSYTIPTRSNRPPRASCQNLINYTGMRGLVMLSGRPVIMLQTHRQTQTHTHTQHVTSLSSCQQKVSIQDDRKWQPEQVILFKLNSVEFITGNWNTPPHSRSRSSLTRRNSPAR